METEDKNVNKKLVTNQKHPTKTSPSKYIWVNLSNTHYPIVHQVVEELGYKITQSDIKPLLFWYDSGGQLDIASSLQLWQFYNHFPSIWSITRKVELAKNIERLQRFMPKVFTFHPKSFLLPGQYSELRSYMLHIPKPTKRTFIIKPDAGAQGKGIILVQNPDQLDDYLESAVAQQYISPFLIDGYKFDLRIYALLTSVDPLRIYIHKEGMARFCTEKYVKPRQSNLHQVYSHLTNYSLNKNNENFQNPDEFNKCVNQVEYSQKETIDRSEMPENDKGSKRSLSSIYRDIEKMGYSTKELKNQIDNIICLTIGSVQPFLAHNYHTAISASDEKSRCFEILGFDILIDKHLNPWLLEVNCMPSLSTDSQFDYDLKHSVVKGALKILSLQSNFKKVVINRQKAETQQRLTNYGSNPASNQPLKSLFDPKKETEISKTTNWRQIYPPTKPNLPISALMESVLIQAKENPVGAAFETAASRARKEAIIKQIRENEQKAKIEKMKASKRPPFSTDTTTPITNAKPPIKSTCSSNLKRDKTPNHLANIVQKPNSKKITRVKLGPSHSSRSKDSENRSSISYQKSAILDTKSNQQKSSENVSLFDCLSGNPINQTEEGERKNNFSEQKEKIQKLNIDSIVSQMTGKSNQPFNQKKSNVNVNPRKNDGRSHHSAMDHSSLPSISKSNKKVRQIYGEKPVLKPVLMCMNS